MNDTKTNPILRLMPSLTDVAFLLPLILLFGGGLAGTFAVLDDGDTGWPSASVTGFLAHHQIPKQDMLSFTKPGEPFFAWNGCGMSVPLAASLGADWEPWDVASLLVISLHFRVAAPLGLPLPLRNPLVAIVHHQASRPPARSIHLAGPGSHLFTMLLLVIYLAMLERVREGHRTRLLWTLPGP